jgi:CubicO group peptidase (beta-lactamase class C family)
VAASGHLPYRIGSITKTFTAAAVLGLAQDGELALDAPVSRYVAGTPFDEVPLRALLAHRGGVQREAPGDMWQSMRGPDASTLRRALPRAELVDRPGARWHYSNLGYALLGLVVEQATGMSCRDLIDRRLVVPLGLTATAWERPTGAAGGYRVDPYADVVHREPDMDQGAVGVGGQLWSTAADLLVWGDALAGGAPEEVAPAVVGAMHTLEVMVDRTGWTSGWGLGLILHRRDDRVLAGHTGAMPGFLASLSLDRATRSVAVALSNATRGAAVGTLSADLVQTVIDGRVGEEPRTAAAPWVPLDGVPPELDGMLGRWWSEAAETVFTWRADGLHARLVGAPVMNETRFERLDRDNYRAVKGRFTGERLAVRRDQSGNVVALEWATYPFTRTPQ